MLPSEEKSRERCQGVCERGVVTRKKMSDARERERHQRMQRKGEQQPAKETI